MELNKCELCDGQGCPNCSDEAWYKADAALRHERATREDWRNYDLPVEEFSGAPEPAPATDAANTVEVLPELTARHKDAILGLGDFGSIHIQHSMIEHQIARDLIKMGYMLFDEVTAHYYLTPAGKTLYGQLPCQNPFNPKYVPPAQNDSPDWKKRAERAESALTDVGAQLEIADTRNTDMVLALERAEAALAAIQVEIKKRDGLIEILNGENRALQVETGRMREALSLLLASVDAVEKTAVNALENYDEYGYEQLAQAAVSAHVCKLIRGAKPGGEGGAV